MGSSERFTVVEFTNGDGDDAYGVWDAVTDGPSEKYPRSTFCEGEAQDWADELNAAIGTVLSVPLDGEFTELPEMNSQGDGSETWVVKGKSR